MSPRLQRDPNAPLALNNYAFALIQTGEVDSAIQHLERALAIAPRLAVAHANMAEAYARKQDFERSAEYARTAMSLGGGDPDVLARLGAAMVMQGKAADALGYLEQSVALRPIPIPMNNLAWVLATHPASSSPRRALSLAQRANNATGGQNPLILDTLAAAHAANGQYREAIAVVQRAIEIAEVSRYAKIVPDLRARLAVYQAGRPHWETGGGTPAP